MKVLKTTLNIGIDKPFSFLHMTDTHFTETDNSDSPVRVEFAAERRVQIFPKARENALFAEQYVLESKLPLFHTGDIIDFFTPANFRFAKNFAEKTNLTLIAGNHEIHTCPNNVFCEDDFTIDLAHREERLDYAQGWFSNDIRYFCREINGVYLVGINNSDYQISDSNFSRLKELSELGKPIILFMHIPLYSTEIYKQANNAMLSIPDEIVDKFSEFQQFEQRANATTKKTVEFIKNTSIFKFVVCGHLHFDFETEDKDDIKQILTGINTLREITVI